MIGLFFLHILKAGRRTEIRPENIKTYSSFSDNMDLNNLK